MRLCVWRIENIVESVAYLYPYSPLEAGAVLLLFFPTPVFFLSFLVLSDHTLLFWESPSPRSLQGVKIRGFRSVFIYIFNAPGRDLRPCKPSSNYAKNFFQPPTPA
jgi:hypothetical protein